MSVSRGSRPGSNVSFYSNSTTSRFGPNMRVPRPSSLSLYGALDQTVRLGGGVEDLPLVLHPEPSEVVWNVMPVGQREVDLLYLRVLLQHCLAHAVKGVLHRGAVMVGEGLEDPVPHPPPRLTEVHVRGVVPPAGDDDGRQNAVVRLGQGGVLLVQVTLKAGVGGLEHQHVVQTGLYCDAARGALHHRRTLPGGPDEGVLVLPAIHHDTVPEVLDEAYAGVLDFRAGLEEVLDQLYPEILDVPGEVVFGQRVDRVPHGVGRQEAGVVALDVGRLEIARERHVYPHVGDLVPARVALDLNQPDVRFAVAALAQDDLPGCRFGHRLPPSSTRSPRRRRAIFEISARAVSISSSLALASRSSAPLRIDSLVCSLTQKIKGMPNFSWYERFIPVNASYSSGESRFSPAAFPARSGCARMSSILRSSEAAFTALSIAPCSSDRLRKGRSRQATSATQGECSYTPPNLATNSSRSKLLASSTVTPAGLPP